MVAFQFNEAVVDMAHQKKVIFPQAFLPNPQAFFPDTQAFFPVLWFYTKFSQKITYQIHDYPSLPLGRPKKGVIVQSWEWKCGCLSAQDVCYKILTPRTPR